MDGQQQPLPMIPRHYGMEPIDEDIAVSFDSVVINSADSRPVVRENKDGNEAILTGILYGRSVRSGYACLHVYCPPEDGDDDNDSLSEGESILVRLQFGAPADGAPRVADNPPSNHPPPGPLRSHVRRFCKPGDLLRLRYAQNQVNGSEKTTTHSLWRNVGEDVLTNRRNERLVLTLSSVQHAEHVLQIVTKRYWTMGQIQACQLRYGYGGGSGGDDACDGKDTCLLVAPSRTLSPKSSQPRHNSGLMKRTQANFVKNFLAHMVLEKLGQYDRPRDASQWAVHRPSDPQMQMVRNYLNKQAGVLDVAGGAGHVSMALGLEGIQSTIVDPREKAGLLPGRDRKFWKRSVQRALRTADEPLYCRPVPVQYNVYRAWFGSRPSEIRHSSQQLLPVCGSGTNTEDADDVLRNCQAIVSMHADEATDSVVMTAVQHRTPFLIVPCCVFYRLFPDRRMPNNPTQPVSKYEDLLDYLQACDDSIQRVRLPFEGANIVLYSIFL